MVIETQAMTLINLVGWSSVKDWEFPRRQSEKGNMRGKIVPSLCSKPAKLAHPAFIYPSVRVGSMFGPKER